MQNNLDIKKVMDMLGTMLRCPICGAKYGRGGTRIIESEEDIAFNEAYVLLHSDCGKCKSSIVFSVEIKGPEVFSVGMVTDLTQNDTIKFRAFRPIESGEVLQMHQGLKKFNGNFVQAFSPKD